MSDLTTTEVISEMLPLSISVELRKAWASEIVERLRDNGFIIARVEVSE